jgi:hypothetical protein
MVAEMASARTGTATLPLHGGKTPRWLFERMVLLARETLLLLREEHGSHELLRRFSDPFWFQAFGCVLGFDWHSSGVTTTTCGAVKEAVRGIEHDVGLWVAGGKGATSRRTPAEVTAACERLGLDPHPLVRASKLAAKVDNTAVQSGHQLYHHSFFLTADGSWSVVQQGMSDATRTARRYHWLGERLASFVDEPHAAVCDDARGVELNLVAHESAGARSAILDVLTMPRDHVLDAARDVDPRRLETILLRTYERPPADFAELLGVPGLGPKSLRALALVAELVYGEKASTRDPARFAFAHGGKDGTPFPVDRDTYDRTIEVLRGAVQRARVGRSEQVKALERLARFASAGV